MSNELPKYDKAMIAQVASLHLGVSSAKALVKMTLV